ncbi:MAG TPA: type IV pilin protein [Gallionella sp.]|nr:type IV pilin protein [Gallionella sp.]
MSKQQGFSLIELMIAVVIVGILAAIAVPSYQSYVVRGNRAAAQAFMTDVANREKQYLLDARVYAADLATLGMTAPTEVSRHYTSITIAVSAAPPTFTITATPTSAQQAADGALTLASDGTKSPADKW